MSKMEDTLIQFMEVSFTNWKNTDAFIKTLEVQVGQLTKQLLNVEVDLSQQPHRSTQRNIII